MCAGIYIHGTAGRIGREGGCRHPRGEVERARRPLENNVPCLVFIRTVGLCVRLVSVLSYLGNAAAQIA